MVQNCLTNNTFVNNYANVSGGAIRITNSLISVFKNNNFTNNTA
jgi:predicted outer membrane repeat protein